MISMRVQCVSRRLSSWTSLLRDLRPGMQARMLLVFNVFRRQAAVGDAPLGGRAGVAADLSCRHEDTQGPAPGARPGVQPARCAALRPVRPSCARSSARACRRVALLDRRLVRLRTGRVDRHRLAFGSLGGQPFHDTCDHPISPQRFQRVWRVLCGPYSPGASHHRKPLRLRKSLRESGSLDRVLCLLTRARHMFGHRAVACLDASKGTGAVAPSGSAGKRFTGLSSAPPHAVSRNSAHHTPHRPGP